MPKPAFLLNRRLRSTQRRSIHTGVFYLPKRTFPQIRSFRSMQRRAGQAPPLRWLIRDFRPPEHFKRPLCLRRREAKGPLAYAGAKRRGPLAYAGAKRKAPLPKGGCRGERSETRLGDTSCCLMRKVSLHRAGAVPLPLGKGGFFAGRRGHRPLRGIRPSDGRPYGGRGRGKPRPYNG